MQENDSTSSGIDLMTWLNFEAAITRNPRVAQSLRDSAAEIGHLRTQLKAAGINSFPKNTDGFLKMFQALKAKGTPGGMALGNATGDSGWTAHRRC